MAEITNMTEADAVAALDALSGDDQESDHGEADEILLRFVPPAVRDAYARAQMRVGFWYA